MDNLVERLKRLHDQLSSNAQAKETLELLGEAIAEIEWLRSHVGAVSHGESFDDIARRVGRVSDEQRM